ncbi:MAG: Ras GTPase [Trichoglossum hirsutum]|nr:MAG: Ras GTPase [Trichoglossum hirsutum]
MPAMPPQRHELIVVGGDAAGKNTFADRFVQGCFITDYDPMRGEGTRKQCVIGDQVTLLSIDFITAGAPDAVLEKRWGSVLRTCEGVLMLYSITSRRSFDEIMGLQSLVWRLREGRGDGLPIILVVGSKCDLESERQISTQEGEAMARGLGCEFMEASAKSGFNVEKAFNDIVLEIRKHGVERSRAYPPSSGHQTKVDKGCVTCQWERCVIL